MRRSIVLLMMLLVLVVLSGILTVAQEDNAQSNKQIYLDVVAEYNAGNREAFYDMFTDPFMMNPGEPFLIEMAVENIRGYDGALFGAMPDMQMNAEVVIAQEDWVTAYVRYTGTYTEPFSFPPIGLDPFEPNDEAIVWTELSFMRFDADGLVDTLWITSDPTILFGQMGIFPMMGGEEDTSNVLEQPVGYQTLSAEELAATFTSGMEERNVALYQEQLDAGPLVSVLNYANPYIAWQVGVPSAQVPDSEEEEAFFGMITTALPDFSMEAAIVVAEGDWVAALVTLSGTFTADADFMGTSLSPTGEPVIWQLGFVDRFDADGVIIEEWVEGDISPMLIGLGFMPPMGE